MNNKKEYYMNEALKEAMKAYDAGEIPVGAIIVKNDVIIARAHNLKESKNCAIKHAEIIAIEEACGKLRNWRLIDCDMYITMFPCPMCASAINQSRITRIFYGTIPKYADKQTVDKILENKYYGLPVIISGPVLEETCGKLISDFFIKKR